MAYLWPTSGVFSGVNALLKSTGNSKYSTMLVEKVLPGLQHYFDDTRKPVCYQSYIAEAGESDCFYDDNVWLAIDFCEAFQITKEQKYLEQSIQLWQFIISGWDDKLGGGIYWCEQKKQSKNTCSNAPASVLAFQLFEATNDSTYFNWGLKIYEWTKQNLQDSTDYLYFDNKNLEGKVDKRKYTYNSGQMLQSAALLYKLTGKKNTWKRPGRLPIQQLNILQKILKRQKEVRFNDLKTPETGLIPFCFGGMKNCISWIKIQNIF
ncbi:MAG: glycoside hydrolase family 76 protein [Draconibacterium sp.]